MKPKILIIEDEENYIDFVRLVFEELGVTEFDKAHTVEEANAALASKRYNLVLTDIRLPNKHEGMEIIKSLRDKDKKVHILALSALGSESYKVMGLEKGADDYISKNDSYAKLKNKIRIHLDRVRLEAEDNEDKSPVSWKNITLLPNGRIISPALDDNVELSFKGLAQQILEHLMKHPGIKFFGKDLKDEFRPDDEITAGMKTIYNSMDRIRDKFKEYGVECPIYSHKGGGYEVLR